MADPTVRGRFVWHELWTPNRAGAHEFYSRAVGWQERAWEHDNSYSMFVGPRGPLGAAVENRNATPQWVPYVGTIDVDATVDAALRLGAHIHTPPTTVPNAGRHAVLVDPHGATFGVHASASAAQPETAAEPGEFSWHELATTVAPAVAFSFYAALFGWEEQSRFDMGPMGVYLIFGRNRMQLGGMFHKGAAGKPGPAYWLGYVRVADFDAAVERAKGAHGSLLTDPMDVPGGDRIAQFMDPHGAFFALHRLAGDRQAAAKPPQAKAARAPAQPAPRPAATKASKPAPAKKPAAKKAPKKKPKKSTKKAAKKPAKVRAVKPAKKKRSAAKPAARPKKLSKPKPKRR